jgi:pimeloyl-ACP methyl ester carboxylesterase
MTTDTDNPAYRDRFVDADGLRLHYTDWNPDAERAMMLVHGLQVQAHTWDPIAEDLARDAHIVCPDLRGHGLSGWPEEGYPLDGFVADLRRVADDAGLRTFDLVGHSLGARIAIAFAAAHPDAVDRLILSDTGPELPPKASAFTKTIVGAVGGDVRGFSNQEQAYEYYRERHPEWQQRFIDLHVEHQLRRNWAGKLVFRSDPDLFWLLGSAGRRDDARLWDALSRCTMPTLIMWGQRSDFFTEDIARRMLDRLPDATLLRTDTGHYIPRERPDVFIEQLRRFVGL